MTDTPIPSALNELSDWLARREAAVAGLVPGAEKHIHFVGGEVRRRPLAVIYLHGFSATRQETHPLADRVAAALDANVYYTRLRGHGLGGEALGEATVTEWLEDGREALAIGERLGERLLLIACSTGATLATALAMDASVDVSAVRAMAFISPNFGVADRSAVILNLPLGVQIARLVSGRELVFEERSEAHARYWTTRYPVEAAATMMQLLRRVWRGDVSRVTMPVLSMYAPRDEVIDVAAIRRMHRRLPNPRNRECLVEDSVDPSQHVIAGDILSPNTTDSLVAEIVGFVESLPATAEASGAAAAAHARA